MKLGAIQGSSTMRWIQPRPGMDPSLRRLTYGKIRPLDEDRTFLERLFGR